MPYDAILKRNTNLAIDFVGTLLPKQPLPLTNLPKKL